MRYLKERRMVRRLQQKSRHRLPKKVLQRRHLAKKKATRKGKQQKNTESDSSSEEVDWKVGDTCEALWDDDGFYYDAIIERVYRDKSYLLRFLEDGVTSRRYRSQMQSTRGSQSSESEVEEKPSAGKKGKRAAQSTKNNVVTEISSESEVGDENYVGNAESSESSSGDVARVTHNISGSESGSEEVYPAKRKPARKRKRVASAGSTSKQRRVQLRENMSHMTKEQILNMVAELVETKSTITMIDLEKAVQSKAKK